MNEKCDCEILKYTNQYADSYECTKCGAIFAVTSKHKLIRESKILDKILEICKGSNNEE